MTVQKIIDSIMNSEEKTKELTDLLIEHTMNSKWISSNIEELRIKHPNIYIAVRNERVILSNKNRTELVDSLMKKYGDIRGITIEYITDKRISLLV